jgi:DNA-binding NarL/FixJ family response regulator
MTATQDGRRCPARPGGDVPDRGEAGGVQPDAVADPGLRVLIVDDHELFREAARRVLAAAGFDVVAGAADGADALRLVRELRPDVVLLDVQLPDTDGFQVARELARDGTPPTVVLVSSRSRSDYGGLVERSGVRGFIDKAELSGARLRAALEST